MTCIAWTPKSSRRIPSTSAMRSSPPKRSAGHETSIVIAAPSVVVADRPLSASFPANRAPSAPAAPMTPNNPITPSE
ncbi:Uncharacterised protein [Mycobacteroides abscessus subsp. abscessus]|nr:Uncharacterised protein [Mycobacteroides abscessus subsp. abscessus]